MIWGFSRRSWCIAGFAKLREADKTRGLQPKFSSPALTATFAPMTLSEMHTTILYILCPFITLARVAFSSLNKARRPRVNAIDDRYLHREPQTSKILEAKTIHIHKKGGKEVLHIVQVMETRKQAIGLRLGARARARGPRAGAPPNESVNRLRGSEKTKNEILFNCSCMDGLPPADVFAK